MQARRSACKIMELFSMSWNCIPALGTACKLIEMPAILWNCIQPWITLDNPWVTLGNLGKPWNWQNDHLTTHGQTDRHQDLLSCVFAAKNLSIDAKKNKCDFETILIRHVILIALFLTFLSTTIIATFLSIFPSSQIAKMM